jgi:hypothetical protein
MSGIPRTRSLILIHKSMMRNNVRFSSMNFPNFMLMIVCRIQNIAFPILNYGSLTLNKIRQFLGALSFVLF